jgi:threonine dehydrogenase-like Zn-dependent dehydrogenase
MFDKWVQSRTQQANVLRWVEAILPLLTDEDPPGADTFASHRLSLEDGPQGYEIFQAQQDDACKRVNPS